MSLPSKRLTFRSTALSAILLVLILISLRLRGASVEVQEVELDGVAQGGEVTLYALRPYFPKWVTISTQAGEAASNVVERFAQLMNTQYPWEYWAGTGDLVVYFAKRPMTRAVGNRLIWEVRFPLLAFTGTDEGFRMLKPVTSLSGVYDAEREVVNLHWLNPPELPHQIQVAEKVLPGHATSCTLDRPGMRFRETAMEYYVVMGEEEGKYSAPACINITTNGQEELFSFPFFHGIAANWTPWSSSEADGFATFEQGLKADRSNRDAIRSPDDKPFFQMIRTRSSEVHAGVWRRFLGLVPGKSYKIQVRVNTLDPDSDQACWQFSVHATPDGPAGQGLTLPQLTGSEALPNGETGPSAARIALFEPGHTTKGSWELCSTGAAGYGQTTGDLTLPDGVTSVTVWLRLSGGLGSGVGMDWVGVCEVAEESPDE